MRSNRPPRNPTIAAVATLAFGLLAACGPGKHDEAPKPVLDVVAEVNGVPISRIRLNQVVVAEDALNRSRGEMLSEEAERNRWREAMRLVISGELCYQAAKASGFEVSEDEIDKQLEGARSQFSSEEAFRESLAESGVDLTQLQRDTERHLVISAYLASVAQDTVIDTDSSDAKSIFEEQRSQFQEPDQIRVSQIVVRFRPNDPSEKKAAARKKIDEAWRLLQADKEFADVAREFSESPMAKDGGDLGYFSRGRTLPEFEDKVFATAVGEMTGVFETSYGFNIALVTDFRAGRSQTFEEVRTGLMMVLAREQRDEALGQHVSGLWDVAEITFLDPELEPAPRTDQP